MQNLDLFIFKKVDKKFSYRYTTKLAQISINSSINQEFSEAELAFKA